jgi:hypothetical protein
LTKGPTNVTYFSLIWVKSERKGMILGSFVFALVYEEGEFTKG